MKLLNDISVIASNNFIELLALKTECDGMTAENHYRQSIDRGVAYNGTDFQIVADKMRALKYDETRTYENKR